jgi:hypothetical protein
MGSMQRSGASEQVSGYHGEVGKAQRAQRENWDTGFASRNTQMPQIYSRAPAGVITEGGHPPSLKLRRTSGACRPVRGEREHRA